MAQSSWGRLQLPVKTEHCNACVMNRVTAWSMYLESMRASELPSRTVGVSDVSFIDNQTVTCTENRLFARIASGQDLACWIRYCLLPLTVRLPLGLRKRRRRSAILKHSAKGGELCLAPVATDVRSWRPSICSLHCPRFLPAFALSGHERILP